MLRAAAIVLLVSLLSLPGVAAQPQADIPAADRVLRLIARGDQRAAMGDAIGALGYYRDAIAAGPRRSEGYLALGNYHLALAEPARALDVFEAAARAEVHAAPLVIAHAETLQKVGRPERALSLLRRLVQHEPGSEAAFAALAQATEGRGLFVEALAARRVLYTLIVQGGGAPERARESATQVRALERLLGDAEHVRARTRCDDATATEITRALARCP